MDTIIALWLIAVFSDVIPAAAITVMQFKRMRELDSETYYYRYSTFLFACIAVSRIIRIWAIVSNRHKIGDGYAWKSFISMTIEAIGLWLYFGFLCNWFKMKKNKKSV